MIPYLLNVLLIEVNLNMTIFLIVLCAVVIQRFIELSYSKRNERLLKSKGAIEYGREHYPLIVLMHALFFVSMFVEFFFSGRNKELNILNYLFLVIFILLQFARIWVLISLGENWSTRILHVPGSKLVKKGPYKFLRHPNYIIVTGEIFCLPMMFNLYITAIVFSLINLILLGIRIKKENEALGYLSL